MPTYTYTKIRQLARRKTRPYYAFAVGGAIALGCTLMAVDLALDSKRDNEFTGLHHIYRRSVNKTNSTTTSVSPLSELSTMPDIGNYPPDLFTVKQWRQGAIILHTAGMVYMFIALAIVCDEFFVPALEVLSAKLHISEDVAGATFMAAGGSAPEFFTSIAGVFLSGNSVGISTIIGSAVFNILFVIGMCGLLAHDTLQLTWWPLFRDSMFYSISLLVLIISYLDWKIMYYEAIVLLVCYAAYVTFMYFNSRIENRVKSAFCRDREQDSIRVSSSANIIFPKANGHKLQLCLKDKTHPRPASSLKFRAGLLQLMISTIDPLAEGRIEDRALQLRTIAMTGKNGASKDQNGNMADQTSALLAPEGNEPSGNESSTDVIQMELNNTNGSAKHNELRPANSNHSDVTAVESIGEEEVSQAETSVAPQAADVNSGASAEENHTAPPEEAGAPGEEADGPLDLSWPKSARKRISYVLLAPIVFPLWLTLPDTRRPDRRNYYPITFIGSIFWIAGFSFLMVWWASSICVAMKIPVDAIGLTVLAGGTSVPDLLTSVIVARKGFGDMAVSSSIGSNLFDITVGLPLPWLISTIINAAKGTGAYQSVDAEGLLCSIVLLFCMLVVTIGSIALFKWKLNKWLGLFLLILYLCFMAVSLLLAFTIIPCIDLSYLTG